MFIYEKQAVYWKLAYTETEEDCQEPSLNITDFILGRFDAERLGEAPPESDWRDWFPPPPPMTDWELDDLADWVELVASRHDLVSDPDKYPI